MGTMFGPLDGGNIWFALAATVVACAVSPFLLSHAAGAETPRTVAVRTTIVLLIVVSLLSWSSVLRIAMTPQDDPIVVSVPAR